MIFTPSTYDENHPGLKWVWDDFFMFDRLRKLLAAEIAKKIGFLKSL
jgi:hypothetical protein